MIQSSRDVATVPDEIARRVILPEGHGDDEALFEAYAWLRENAPMAVARVEGYDPVWLVSKHADIMEIARQPDLFTNSGGAEPGTHNPIFQNQAGDEFTKTITGGSLRVVSTTTYFDPPELFTIRDIVAPSFRPVSLKNLDDRIRVLAQEAIKHQLTKGTNELDIVRDFCLAYPLRVIMTLIGVPPEDEPLMLSLTQEFFGTTDPDTHRDDVPLTPDAAARQWWATIKDFYSYFDVILEDRMVNPAEDLATVIASARHPETGEPFPKDISWGWFVNVAAAGHDTTSSTLAGILEALAKNPDQFELIKSRPELTGSLVNEGLRWVSPVKHFARRATADYELRGQRIEAGDRFMLLYQAANRDADAFEQPDTFRLDRPRNNHLAFGYGPHMCIGQHLAKQELRIMLEELLPRLTSLEVTGPRKVVSTNHVGGLKHLPMRLDIA